MGAGDSSSTHILVLLVVEYSSRFTNLRCYFYRTSLSLYCRMENCLHGFLYSQLFELLWVCIDAYMGTREGGEPSYLKAIYCKPHWWKGSLESSRSLFGHGSHLPEIFQNDKHKIKRNTCSLGLSGNMELFLWSRTCVPTRRVKL